MTARLPEDVILEHIEKMLHAPTAPNVPCEAADSEALQKIHEYLIELRQILTSFAKGELAQDIILRGVVAGRLKALQANILHLTWQIQQVANGDFSQRVEFMGDFSTAFNSMVTQLDQALTALREKEEQLTQLNAALQHEIEQKDKAMKALSKSEARFRYMAEHDTLTGVLNRRSFYDLAALELAAAQQQKKPCNLVMLDVDYFKRFNDTYGHLEGDAALRHVTGILQNALRQNDIVGRYGGEEFVLFFPNTPMDAGEAIAGRLRQTIADTPVATTFGPVSITASLGLVHIPYDTGAQRDISFLEEALSLADQALYEAKNAGRNILKSTLFHTRKPAHAPKLAS